MNEIIDKERDIRVRGEIYTEIPEDLFIPPDALRIILEEFEGPLDLLLYLIKKQNIDISNIDAIERFMGSKLYEKVSSGKFHDEWFERLKENDFVDKTSGEKISKEVLRLLNLQKEAMIKQLIKFPDLYYAKSHFPLEISQRATNHLWRVCESYELWCKETKNNSLIKLNLLD